MSNFDIGGTAKGLAKNPLGIIALFIVLVYGFASLVTAFASSFEKDERIPLIYFLVIYPILVLIAFVWLVSKHSSKLFAPSDFKDETNYVKMQLAVAASLTAASAKDDQNRQTDIEKIVETVQHIKPKMDKDVGGWKNRILWVDDRPKNNTYERQAFKELGIKIKLALSTNEALEYLDNDKYGVIISDMGRKEGPREGYVLLEEVRKTKHTTPFFIYAGSNSPEHKREAKDLGAQGSTNNPQELFEMVTKELFETSKK